MPLGFAFGRGTLTAIGQTGTLATWSASMIPKNSIEAVFDATAKPRLLLDTRQIAYFVPQRFPDDFDLLIYLSSTNASSRVPFMY